MFGTLYCACPEERITLGLGSAHRGRLQTVRQLLLIPFYTVSRIGRQRTSVNIVSCDTSFVSVRFREAANRPPLDIHPVCVTHGGSRVSAHARHQGTDMRLEVEALFTVGSRHVELDRAALELLDPRQHLRTLLGIRIFLQRPFD
jgi:hypothetical protein